MSDNEPTLPAFLRDLLEANGVQYRLHSHPPLLTVRDIEAVLAFPKEQWVKALAFRIKGDGWVLAALQAYSRLDYRKLADALGIKRGQLEQPSPEELLQELGFQAGGVPPIPPRPDVRVVYDTPVVALPTAYCGTGRSDLTLEIPMPDLLRLVHPGVADLASERYP
jgi:Cys-tRNA(Pro)/Cys-tRNA(Cys) deacylase